jgi:hypothetical protein
VYAHATHCVPHEAVLTPKHSTETTKCPTAARLGLGQALLPPKAEIHPLGRRWVCAPMLGPPQRIDLLGPPGNPNNTSLLIGSLCIA